MRVHRRCSSCDVDGCSSVYLLHAYDYCPNDPMICLGLAISSMGRAMQRQSDNRHHLIAQVKSPNVGSFLSHRLTAERWYRQWRSLHDTVHSFRWTGLNRTKLSITLVARFSNSVSVPFAFPSTSQIIFTVDVGLHSLAVKHYERVLEIAEKKTSTNPDVGHLHSYAKSRR